MKINIGNIYLFTYEKEYELYVLNDYLNKFREYAKKNNMDFYTVDEMNVFNLCDFVLERQFFSGKIIYVKKIDSPQKDSIIELTNLAKNLNENDNVILIILDQKKSIKGIENIIELDVSIINNSDKIKKIREYINENGFRIEDKLIGNILDKFNYDILKTKFEIDKLFAFCADYDEILQEDIDSIAVEPNEYEISQIVKNLIKKNQEEVFKIINTLLSRGMQDIAILKYISKAFSNMYESLFIKNPKNFKEKSMKIDALKYKAKDLKEIDDKLKEIQIAIREDEFSSQVALQLAVCYILSK